MTTRKITLPDLYDHQDSMRVETRQGLLEDGAVIVAAEPGTGKTRLAKAILGAAASVPLTARKSGRVLFSVYGRNLVDNASCSFMEEPHLRHGVIMSGQDTDWNKRVHVGSISTLISWYCDGDKYTSDTTFDLIVFDECHSNFKQFLRFITLHNVKRKELGFHPAYVLGLSATPDTKGLADLFKRIVTGPTTEWLIENKYLSPFEYVAAKQGKLDLLVKRGNKFTDASQHAAMDGMTGDMVRDWQKYGKGRPTIGFFRFLSHARDARDLLIEHGVNASYVDGKTPDKERKEIFARLANGSTEYLCNVGVVERGTNIPPVSCIQLCLAIQDLKRYRQMIGRASRMSPGKVNSFVIDHGGNIARHGFFEDTIKWDLDNTRTKVGKVREKPSIVCPECSRVYRGGRCLNCEYEPTVVERKNEGLVFTGGELVRIDRKAKRASRPKKIMSNHDILVSSLYAGAKRGMTWRAIFGMCYGRCKGQNTKFKCPRRFKLSKNGPEFEAIKFNDPDGFRKVSELFEPLRKFAP